MVRGGAAAEQQAHRGALVPEGGLHADEDLAKLLPKHQQLAAIGVQLACTDEEGSQMLTSLVQDQHSCKEGFQTNEHGPDGTDMLALPPKPGSMKSAERSL